MNNNNFLTRVATLVAIQSVGTVLGVALLMLYFFAMPSIALLIGGTSLLIVAIVAGILLLAGALRKNKSAGPRHARHLHHTKPFSPKL